MKSHLKWSQVFELYRKIRAVESGKSDVEFICDATVAIYPTSQLMKDRKNAIESASKIYEYSKQITTLVSQKESIKDSDTSAKEFTFEEPASNIDTAQYSPSKKVKSKRRSKSFEKVSPTK